MARAVDRSLKLFRREKLRNRSLQLKLRECACFEFVDFSLRERRIANDIRKQIKRLVQVLNQATHVDRADHRRQTGAGSQRSSESVNLLRDVFAGALGGAFTQQRCGEARETAKVRLV